MKYPDSKICRWCGIERKLSFFGNGNKTMCNECRIKYNELFKIKQRIRNLIAISIKNKGYKKDSRSEQILGCSFVEFKIYLESKFEHWMTWQNHGKYERKFNVSWDIDHIIPISSANTYEDIIKLNHFTNLQPLDSYINRKFKRGNLTWSLEDEKKKYSYEELYDLYITKKMLQKDIAKLLSLKDSQISIYLKDYDLVNKRIEIYGRKY